MIEEVVLVNEKDEAVGTMEKMAAHEQAILHRAFSVFVFNNGGDILMHQRAHSKYHSGGLWTNTCCSHPRPGETLDDAVTRRLMAEMGITAKVSKAFDFCKNFKMHKKIFFEVVRWQELIFLCIKDYMKTYV